METIKARKVFTGKEWLQDVEIRTEGQKILSVKPAIADKWDFEKGFLMAGMIDLQVYGGGGKLFSNEPDLATINATYEEIYQSGTRFFQITMNCAPMDYYERALKAAKEYQLKGGKGLLGVHLEGPFFNPEKKGAHLKKFIQVPSKKTIDQLLSWADGLALYMTIAPEMFDEKTLKYLVETGIELSIGHSNATEKEMEFAMKLGINKVTHLFNAQSQWESRALGVAGTTLKHPLWASIIVDGQHCDYGSVELAKRLKGEKLFFITDAVTENTKGPYSFSKNGDRFTDEKGILSGSSLTMYDAMLNAVKNASIPLEEAIRMATLYPAQVLGKEKEIGQIIPGASDELIYVEL